MKIFITLFFITIFTSSVYADYTIQNAYNLTNFESINAADGSKIISFTGNELSKDSRGNLSKGKCIVSIKNKILLVNCESTDQDGDIVYSTLYRDTNKGKVGTRTVTGGTGKYLNSNDVCSYEADMLDLKLGIALLSGECKE